MKKYLLIICCLTLMGCQTSTYLSHVDHKMYTNLELQGVNIDHPVGNYKKPVSRLATVLLSFLPGGGHFYLAFGKAKDRSQISGIFEDILFYPLSIFFAGQTGRYAEDINRRELLYYYMFDEEGKQELEKAGISLTNQCTVK